MRGRSPYNDSGRSLGDLYTLLESLREETRESNRAILMAMRNLVVREDIEDQRATEQAIREDQRTRVDIQESTITVSSGRNDVALAAQKYWLIHSIIEHIQIELSNPNPQSPIRVHWTVFMLSGDPDFHTRGRYTAILTETRTEFQKNQCADCLPLRRGQPGYGTGHYPIQWSEMMLAEGCGLKRLLHAYKDAKTILDHIAPLQGQNTIPDTAATGTITVQDNLQELSQAVQLLTDHTNGACDIDPNNFPVQCLLIRLGNWLEANKIDDLDKICDVNRLHRIICQASDDAGKRLVGYKTLIDSLSKTSNLTEIDKVELNEHLDHVEALLSPELRERIVSDVGTNEKHNWKIIHVRVDKPVDVIADVDTDPAQTAVMNVSLQDAVRALSDLPTCRNNADRRANLKEMVVSFMTYGDKRFKRATVEAALDSFIMEAWNSELPLVRLQRFAAYLFGYEARDTRGP